MNELIFNGVNFTKFDSYYATSNFLDGAAKDVQSVSVVGRSGDLQLSNNRYKNLPLKIRVYVTKAVEANMRAMRNFLESVNGYARVEISNLPNEYRMAAYKEIFTPYSFDSEAGAVDLIFDSMPQLFLKSGESSIDISASPSELVNPTLFESKPIIRAYGNGILNVNDIYITVSGSPYTYIDIDCELMDCYYGSNNANQYVSFSTTDYVTLRSGMNYFSYSGFTKVEVTPRWFEI